MVKGKVLITEVIHPILAKELTQFGFDCTHIEKISYEEISAIISDYVGLIVRSKIVVDKKLLDKASSLHFIGRYGSGMELIDVAYATQKGIKCFNSPEGNKDAVAEQAVGMLMALLHNIVKSDGELRNHFWNRKANSGTELMGKTIGIIGYGNTGSAFAQRLKGFEVTILAYDKYKTGFGNQWVKEVDIATIFKKADIVSFHLPLNLTTRYLIDAEFINQFTKPIYLLNTSRGGILHTKEVLKALDKKQLKGLALDVFENEDLATFTEEDWNYFSSLTQRSNVVITPHTAGLSKESAYKLGYILAQKIKQEF